MSHRFRTLCWSHWWSPLVIVIYCLFLFMEKAIIEGWWILFIIPAFLSLYRSIRQSFPLTLRSLRYIYLLSLWPEYQVEATVDIYTWQDPILLQAKEGLSSLDKVQIGSVSLLDMKAKEGIQSRINVQWSGGRRQFWSKNGRVLYLSKLQGILLVDMKRRRTSAHDTRSNDTLFVEQTKGAEGIHLRQGPMLVRLQLGRRGSGYNEVQQYCSHPRGWRYRKCPFVARLKWLLAAGSAARGRSGYRSVQIYFICWKSWRRVDMQSQLGPKRLTYQGLELQGHPCMGRSNASNQILWCYPDIARCKGVSARTWAWNTEAVQTTESRHGKGSKNDMASLIEGAKNSNAVVTRRSQRQGG